MAREFAAAIKQYSPKPAPNPKDLAQLFLSIAQGSIILMKAKKDKNVFATNLKHFKAYLKSIFGR